MIHPSENFLPRCIHCHNGFSIICQREACFPQPMDACTRAQILSVSPSKPGFSDTCESSKKPFCKVLHQQHCWAKGKHSIGGEDVVSDEVFHSGKIWDRLSFLQAFILTYFTILRYPSERRQHISEQKPSWWIEKLTPYNHLKPCSEEQWSHQNNGCPS